MRSSVDVLAELAVVCPGATGGAGHEEVVDAAAEHLRGALGIVERDLQDLEVPAQGTLAARAVTGDCR